MSEPTPKPGIPDINSLLYKPATEVWAGEQQPSARLADLINTMNAAIAKGYSFNHEPEVEEMASLRLEPSQEMRLRYFRGYFMRDNSVRRDFERAYEWFDHALDIALEHGDLDSQIVLADQQALMMYGLGRNREAIYHYQVALALWQKRARQIPNPGAGPDIQFYMRLGTAQFSAGEFEAAAGSLARALTIVTQRPDVSDTNFTQEATAKAFWALGLIHRAQSDMEDGSERLLQSAVQHMQNAIALFYRYGAHEYDIARIHIQVGETLIDLSDLYLQKQQDSKAREARKQALQYITTARSVQYHSDSADPTGRALTELALLRHQITRLPDVEAILEIEDFGERLSAIEQEAEKKSFSFILGKVAALRGEWLLWLGDAPGAREAFVLALAELQANSIGEATRVQRLLRRSNDENRPQRVARTRASGPRVSHSRKRN